MMLQKFGIEIRKIGNSKNLYSEIDMVLKRSGIESGEVNTEVQTQALAHSLQKMLTVDSWFSICTIKDCAEMCGICISKERLDIYRTCHCIHWSAMLPEFRQTLVAMVLDDFRSILNPN